MDWTIDKERIRNWEIGWDCPFCGQFRWAADFSGTEYDAREEADVIGGPEWCCGNKAARVTYQEAAATGTD